MPSNPVKLENIKKNLTNAEKAARQAAQERVARPCVRLSMPSYVRADREAKKYWKKAAKDMEGLELLDNLDSDTLGGYCMQLVRRDMLSQAYMSGMANVQCLDPVAQADTLSCLDDILGRLQSQERLVLQYADKLGLTPNGRARLAYKRAEVEDVDPDEVRLFGGG